MKLVELRHSKLVGISNLLSNSSRDANSFFTNNTATLEIINLTEQDLKSLHMTYLNAKDDLSSDNPSDIKIYHNSYVNSYRNIYEFAIIRNLYFDRITCQLVAQNGDMRKIKDFLSVEPRKVIKTKRALYKSKAHLGSHFLREFSKEERKLCYRLKQRKDHTHPIDEIISVYYDDGYSINDVIKAYDISFYNISEIIDEIAKIENTNDLRNELQEIKEFLEEEDNSF